MMKTHIWRAAAGVAVFVSMAACVKVPVGPTPGTPGHGRVNNVPGMPRAADDPALRGIPPSRPLAIPPRGKVIKGSNDAEVKTTWLPITEATLAPNESRKLSVSFGEGVIVVARAIWTRGAGPVGVVVQQGGVAKATAKPVLGPPDHGASLAQVTIAAPGTADVIVTNHGTTPVAVRATVGTVPLSAAPAPH